MSTVDLFIQAATDFYENMEKDKNGSDRSWEYCYKHFHDARNSKNADIDYLSLHLSFYLASWGMYRSSFLSKKDYRVHMPAIREILKEEYDPLFGIKCVEYFNESNQNLLKALNMSLCDIYDGIRKNVKKTQPKSKISDTLITKILLGTLGCVPAYDRFFIMAVKKHNITTGSYNIPSIKRLAEFYENNSEQLECLRKAMSFDGLTYPQMKVLDMGFWQIGSDMKSK